MIFTTVLSIPVMEVGHLIAFMLKTVPDERFDSTNNHLMKDMIEKCASSVYNL